jgi:hypothetical protein
MSIGVASLESAYVDRRRLHHRRRRRGARSTFHWIGTWKFGGGRQAEAASSSGPDRRTVV